MREREGGTSVGCAEEKASIEYQVLERKEMRGLLHIQLFQATFAASLGLCLLLNALCSSTLLHRFLWHHSHVTLAILWCLALTLFLHIRSRSRRVFMLDYSCFKPDLDQKASYEVCEYFVRRSGRFSTVSEEFMRGIYLKSGLSDETYVPPFIFNHDYDATLRSAVDEADQGIFGAISDLLAKTDVSVSDIDHLIVTCSVFATVPSLSSRIVKQFGMKETVRTFNLSGMGCSSGVSAVDLAGRILRNERKTSLALVVMTENMSLNWYFGDNRSMLVTNCIFRLGTAAVLMSNRRREAVKLELVNWLRTHHGADDRAYKAAFQEEDVQGTVGFSLTKDLIRVSGDGLRAHLRIFAPRVLPYSQLLAYVYANVKSKLFGSDASKPHVPDFMAGFEHACIHTGGKAVIDNIGRVLKLKEEVTEPARMALHRFGNTSSSLVFYEYAYFEAKKRVKKGDRVWMLAFGTGFKVSSLVWKAMKDSSTDPSNPWADCIHRYPVKAW